MPYAKFAIMHAPARDQVQLLPLLSCHLKTGENVIFFYLIFLSNLQPCFLIIRMHKKVSMHAEKLISFSDLYSPNQFFFNQAQNSPL